MQLPDIPDVAAWKSFVRGPSRQDDAPFEFAIHALWEFHGLGRAVVARAARGSTPVFFVDELVIKFVPPPHLEEAVREAGALRELAKKLPVRTPEMIASGTWGTWRYLVSTRIPGTSFRDSEGLSESDRCSVAEQVGALLRSLHDLSASEFHEGACDWRSFVEERWLRAPEFQREHRLHADAVATLDARLRETPLVVDDRRSILHGDLHHEHVLLERVGAAVRVVGIIDFGDAIVGHPEYELITPMFFIAAESKNAQRAMLDGYRYEGDAMSARRLTALSAIHQFNALARFLPEEHGADALDLIHDRYWAMASEGQGSAR